MKKLYFVFCGVLLTGLGFAGPDFASAQTCSDSASITLVSGLPANMIPGNVYQFSVNVTNNGSVTWDYGESPGWQLWQRTGYSALVASRNPPDAAAYYGVPYGHTSLTPPGNSYVWTFNFTAPSSNGTMQFQMHWGRVGNSGDYDCPADYFGQQLAIPFTVAPTVPIIQGTHWCETEFLSSAFPFNGVWIRRGGSNIYDATWTRVGTGQVVTAELAMTYSGNGGVVSISRYNGSDANVCTYSGVSYNGTNISGSYTCSLSAGDNWSAVVNGSCYTPPPPPTCSVNFSPNSIYIGQSTNLSWSSADDTDGVLDYSCTGNIGSGQTTATGSITVNPLGNQTCTFTVANSTGTNTCSASVAAVPPPPSASINCNGSSGSCSVPYNSSATVSWTCLNSTSGTVTNSINSTTWSALNDARTISNLTSNATYDLVCTGAGGTANAQVTINVGAAPPVVNLTANPTSVAYNGSSTLSWTVSNVTNCTASGGWSGSIPPSNGSQSTGNLTSNQTYMLSCTGPGGTTSGSASVVVGAAPPPPTVTIDCNGFSSCVIIQGTAATINWSSSNATNCIVSPSGWIGLFGPQNTGPLNASTTYTVDCTSLVGSASASVVVTVIPPAPPPPPTPPPTPPPPTPPPPVAQSIFNFSIPNPFAGSIDEFDDLFDAIILFLYYIAGPIIVMMVILAGLFLIFGRGEADKINKGKKILLYATIGFIIILIGRGFIALLEFIIDLGN